MIKHHATCHADYPEKPKGEAAQALFVTDLPDGSVAHVCVDCGAYELLIGIAPRILMVQDQTHFTAADHEREVARIRAFMDSTPSRRKWRLRPGALLARLRALFNR
jgi:hypothetical protein